MSIDRFFSFRQAQQFQRTIPRLQQKRLSTFYTQPGAALLLTDLTIESPNDIILDPACGSGILLLAALIQKQRLHDEQTPLKKSIIQTNQLVGCEIDPLAADFACQLLKISKNSDGATTPVIVTGNAFTASFPQVDVVLMNPPFTRQERLSAEDQAIIKKKAEELGLTGYLEGQMSLSAIFIFLADAFLRNNGRIGMVIPAATFSSRYTRQVIRFLNDRHYAVRYLIEVLGENSAFSEDCRYKEYLLVLEKGVVSQEMVPTITLSEPPVLDSVERIGRAIKGKIGKFAELGVTKGSLSREQLFSFKNWEIAFKYCSNVGVFNILDSLPIIPFEQQTFASIRSGFHGTYVDFLFLPNDYWKIIENQYPRSITISGVGTLETGMLPVPPHLLKRAFRKPENTQALYSDASHFVLSIPPDSSLPNDFQTYYLEPAESRLRESLAGKRSRGGKETGRVHPRWYSHAFCNGAEKSIGHLWTFEKIYPINRANLSTFSREPVTAPNMFHLIYGDDLERLEALHSWFNTTFFFCEYLLHTKTIRRGWLKGTIGLFKTLRMPDLSSPFFTREKIAKAQQAIRTFARALDPQPIPIAQQIGTVSRKEFDLAWAEILEIPAAMQEKVTQQLGEFILHFVEQR